MLKLHSVQNLLKKTQEPRLQPRKRWELPVQQMYNGLTTELNLSHMQKRGRRGQMGSMFTRILWQVDPQKLRQVHSVSEQLFF